MINFSEEAVLSQIECFVKKNEMELLKKEKKFIEVQDIAQFLKTFKVEFSVDKLVESINEGKVDISISCIRYTGAIHKSVLNSMEKNIPVIINFENCGLDDEYVIDLATIFNEKHKSSTSKFEIQQNY